MATIYVIGAGFSKTCGIATDIEMLDALNCLVPRTITKLASFQTSIEAFKEQNFHGCETVGFELFMSTLAALKFMPEFMGLASNVFRDGEKEIQKALRRYLKEKTNAVNWNEEGKTILDFVQGIDWEVDSLITFNYDLLIETALERKGISSNGRILHLHASLKDKTLVYPTYRKLAYKTKRTVVAERWKRAHSLLQSLGSSDRLIFIGYSMPPTDLEAKGLFNYTDWYSCYYRNNDYAYPIVVLDKNGHVLDNYSFFRRSPKLINMTFAKWVEDGLTI